MAKVQLYDGLDGNAGTSLAAVTANGNGTVVDFGSPKRCVTLAISTTGAPTAGTVTLSVSIDGVTFVASTTTATVSANPAVSHLQHVAVRYARADLTGLTGGTTPTVTAKVMGS